MIKTRNRSTTALGSLIPSHSDWVKSVQVAVDGILGAFSSKNDDSGTSENSGVRISGRWGSSANLWLEPSARVDIQDMGIVQVSEASLLSFVEVSTEDNEGSAGQSGRVTASGRWRHTFDLGERPQPLPLSYKGQSFKIASALTFWLLVGLLHLFHFQINLIEISE